jgi:hypothetical protein
MEQWKAMEYESQKASSDVLKPRYVCMYGIVAYKLLIVAQKIAYGFSCKSRVSFNCFG